MTKAAKKLLATFETLPEPDKQELAVEILRHTLNESYSSPDDSDLVFAADQLFLELDRRESQD
ncbi:MAG: hypothetical protein QOF89_2940 [Acidobacteriota bacterium]|jgi:hypothetical protein|nr:hypothetical protein [Acidobacteriota bacterium]